MKKRKVLLAGCLILAFLSGCQKLGEEGLQESSAETAETAATEESAEDGKRETAQESGAVSEEPETSETSGTAEEALPDLMELKDGDRITRQITKDILLDVIVELPEKGVSEAAFYKTVAAGLEVEAAFEKLVGYMPETTEDWDEHMETGKVLIQGIGSGSFVDYLYTGNLKINGAEMRGSMIVSPQFRYSTDHWDKLETAFPISGYENGYSFRKPQQLEDYAFATREEAADAGKQYLEEVLGIPGVNHLKTYCFNYQQMQETEEEMYYDPTVPKRSELALHEWDEGDNCYWMFYEQLFEGIPLLSNQVVWQDDLIYIPEGQIRVGYTENGPEYVNINNYFKTLGREETELAPLEKVLAALQAKYEMAMTGENTISEMKLIYYPLPTGRNEEGLQECDMIPAWQFAMKEEMFGDEYVTYIYVDARSGMEIIG